MEIAPLKSSPLLPLTPESRPEPAGPEREGGQSFSGVLEQAIQHDLEAQRAADLYAAGQSQDLHGTMVALEKADISLTLLVNVRNKLLDAYREVMRMS